MTPHAFTIQRVPAKTVGEWRVDDPLVESLWLPRVGPTAFCLLRHLHHTLQNQAEYFAPVTFKTYEVGEALFVPAPKVAHTLTRLRSFHLIDEDDITTSYEHPMFLWRGTVPPIGPKHWRRLPASVRERFAEIPL